MNFRRSLRRLNAMRTLSGMTSLTEMILSQLMVAYPVNKKHANGGEERGRF